MGTSSPPRHQARCTASKSNNTGNEVGTIDLTRGLTSSMGDTGSSPRISQTGKNRSLTSVFGANSSDSHTVQSQATKLPGTLSKKSKFKAPRAILQATSANQQSSHSRYMPSHNMKTEAGALQFIGRQLSIFIECAFKLVTDCLIEEIFNLCLFFDERSGRSLWQKICAPINTGYVSRYSPLPNSISHVSILQWVFIYRFDVAFIVLSWLLWFSALLLSRSTSISTILQVDFIISYKLKRNFAWLRNQMCMYVISYYTTNSIRSKLTPFVSPMIDASAEGSPILQVRAVFPEARTH